MTDALLHGFSLPSKAETDYINIVGAKDCTLVDDQGTQYLDAMASLWLCQIGHGNAKVINAIKDQLDLFSIVSPKAVFPLKKRASEKLLKLIEKEADPSGKIFYTLSGAESVENALKMAREIKKKQIILCRQRSYHGPLSEH